MADNCFLLLLTRPAAASTRFAAAAEARFGAMAVVISPLQEIVFAGRVPGLAGAEALAFTSENGVAAFLAGSPERGLPAFCVGERTAAAARAGGLSATAAGGDLAELAAEIGAAGVRSLLHLHGAERAGDLAALLPGVEVRAASLYRQEAREPTAAALAALAGGVPVLAPVFSPRSARLFRAAFPAPRAPLALVALSPAVAAALGQRPGETVAVAARPEAGAMLDAMEGPIAAARSA